ncbi:DNL-type zinc finger protein [Trichoplax sp. H2]|nr:DNL-type zinc finger protein [Trichoplax sp. H2]|eukprot:RDD43901.1 DNL-type zinc finger protein [Trichoplax sp. H2]
MYQTKSFVRVKIVTVSTYYRYFTGRVHLPLLKNPLRSLLKRLECESPPQVAVPIFHRCQSCSTKNRLDQNRLNETCSKFIDENKTTNQKFFIDKNISLTFTCKVCDSRSTKVFSRQAYENGVVIVRCENCQNLHLISDNKGWFYDSKIDIEKLLKSSQDKKPPFDEESKFASGNGNSKS